MSSQKDCQKPCPCPEPCTCGQSKCTCPKAMCQSGGTDRNCPCPQKCGAGSAEACKCGAPGCSCGGSNCGCGVDACKCGPAACCSSQGCGCDSPSSCDCARVGRKAPNVKGQFVMADNSFKQTTLEEAAKGKYVCLFFYPLDFTFVCPSEILAFNEKLSEFESRNCVLVGCSVDSHFTHLAWKKTPVDKGGIGQIGFPLISDLSKCAAKSYGVLHPDGVALRGLFIMDKDMVLRHALVNDLPLGRSVDEALRILDALQFHEEHGDVCPANWRKGQKAMKPSSEGVAEYLKENFSK